MGSVLSAPFLEEVFFMNLATQKKNPERLAMVPLTTAYLQSPDNPLFVKFCALRKIDIVRQWYCRDPALEPKVLPAVETAPNQEKMWKLFVEPNNFFAKTNVHPNELKPMPVMLVKMNDVTSSERPNATNCQVLGYLGCHHHDAGTNSVVSCGTLGVFLDPQFKQKSLSCIRMACECYRRFCIRAGCRPDSIPWPQAVRFDTLRGNLPVLKLASSIFRQVPSAQQREAVEAGDVSITFTSDIRLRLEFRGGSLIHLLTTLCDTVVDRGIFLELAHEDPGRNTAKSQFDALEDCIEEATVVFKEWNAVIERRHPSENRGGRFGERKEKWSYSSQNQLATHSKQMPYPLRQYPYSSYQYNGWNNGPLGDQWAAQQSAGFEAQGTTGLKEDLGGSHQRNETQAPHTQRETGGADHRAEKENRNRRVYTHNPY